MLASLLLGPGFAIAEKPTIGYLSVGERARWEPSGYFRAFHEGLRERGWVPGQTIAIEYRFDEGVRERLPALISDLVRRRVKVIFVATRPAMPVAMKISQDVPLVFVSLGDPVADGWVQSFARPGANRTGMAGLSPELSGKRIELLREIIPGLSKVGVLWNPDNPGEAAALNQLGTAARATGIDLAIHAADSGGAIEPALDAIGKSGAQAVIVAPDPTFNTQRDLIIRRIAELRLPAIYFENVYGPAGGLMTFSPNLWDMARQAAGYVDRILRGAKASELPIERPTKFELVINMKTARALGLAIPPSVLERADLVIE